MKNISLTRKIKTGFCAGNILVAVFLAGLILTVGTVAASTPQQIVAAHADDFNSGSPEAKNIWDGLAAAVNANDSATTLTVLEQLRNAEGLATNQLQAIAELDAALKMPTPPPAVNTALIPAPRDFPTNWLARHAENLAVAKK